MVIIYLTLQKIYRCWIVWGYSIRVVIAPSFLAFAFSGTLIYLHSLTDFNLCFLAIWIASGSTPASFVQGQIYVAEWRTNALQAAGLTLSMIVNALVTGLIVFRIFKVFQGVKTATADNHISGVTGGSTLRRVIFIITESGMALFSIQLPWLLATIMSTEDAFYALIHGIHTILNVIMTINHYYVILLIT